MSKKKKAYSSNVAISRYGWLAFAMLSVFTLLVYFIVKIKYVEGDVWRELGKRQTVKQDRIVRPSRGNIFADDGRLLATSTPLYGIYIDFMAEGIVKDTLMKNLDPLASALANKCPGRTREQYRKIILDGWNLSRKEINQIAQARKEGRKSQRPKSRHIRIISSHINYLDLKELKTFPFLNQRSNKSGLIEEEMTMRLKPFGRIAGRTIGSIYKDLDDGGASGLELKYDSLLKGETGIKTRQKVSGRWIDVIIDEPVDGIDIATTINVDYQDIAEKSLYSKLSQTNAESGCAIVMEVETGEIKAIANLDKVSDGVYAEGKPNAFSYMVEPGSTFKTISLLVALEDGVVSPDDLVDAGNGLFQYARRTVRDHDWRKGKEKGQITIAEGIHTSSNVSIAKTILKGYEDNPTKFAERIQELGITKKIEWDIPLTGVEGTCIIRMPNDARNPWSKTTLPWMSFGYETQVPPIYMLMFYNGIANNGRMLKPFLTKAFIDNGKIIEEFETEVINGALASQKTIKQVQDILRGVVTDGTGKAVNSSIVTIAGKTGTAQLAMGGRYGNSHYVSFVGYFPAENPKYTCFVGIMEPKGIPSGGLMPGAVFKNIAEGITVREMVSDPILAPIDTLRNHLPEVKNGLYANAKKTLDKLDIKYLKSDNEWVRVNNDTDNISFSDREIAEQGLVPNVIGMGARDAIYLLENANLVVSIEGSGRVRSQSINAGSRYQRGSRIEIKLK